MIEGLLELPSHLRERLARACETGAIELPCSAATLREELGDPVHESTPSAALEAFGRLEIAGPVAAAWIRSLSRAAGRGAGPALVWTGPEVPGLRTERTRDVYGRLIGSATHSLWISTFVYFDGPRAFAPLAERMDEITDLRVTLLLNVQRKRGDTTSGDDLVRRFADRLWSRDWPGRRRPDVFYDPRSLEAEGPRGVLHAKAVVADERFVFTTSANLTEAALDTNIELGLVVDDRSLAVSVLKHLHALIHRGLLAPLPSA